MLARMFSRVLLGAAIGSAVATWLATQRRHDRPTFTGRLRARRDWHPGHEAGPNGRLDDDALADGASEDSFPASDPPARMGALVAGGPPRPRQRAFKTTNPKAAVPAS